MCTLTRIYSKIVPKLNSIQATNTTYYYYYIDSYESGYVACILTRTCNHRGNHNLTGLTERTKEPTVYSWRSTKTRLLKMNVKGVRKFGRESKVRRIRLVKRLLEKFKSRGTPVEQRREVQRRETFERSSTCCARNRIDDCRSISRKTLQTILSFLKHHRDFPLTSVYGIWTNLAIERHTLVEPFHRFSYFDSSCLIFDVPKGWK